MNEYGAQWRNAGERRTDAPLEVSHRAKNLGVCARNQGNFEGDKHRRESSWQ